MLFFNIMRSKWLRKKCSYSELFWSVFSRIRSYSGQYFPVFGLNAERYGVSLRIQSECGKTRTKITPNTDTFHAVIMRHACGTWSVASKDLT